MWILPVVCLLNMDGFKAMKLLFRVCTVYFFIPCKTFESPQGRYRFYQILLPCVAAEDVSQARDVSQLGFGVVCVKFPKGACMGSSQAQALTRHMCCLL